MNIVRPDPLLDQVVSASMRAELMDISQYYYPGQFVTRAGEMPLWSRLTQAPSPGHVIKMIVKMTQRVPPRSDRPKGKMDYVARWKRNKIMQLYLATAMGQGIARSDFGLAIFPGSRHCKLNQFLSNTLANTCSMQKPLFKHPEPWLADFLYEGEYGNTGKVVLDAHGVYRPHRNHIVHEQEIIRRYTERTMLAPTDELPGDPTSVVIDRVQRAIREKADILLFDDTFNTGMTSGFFIAWLMAQGVPEKRIHAVSFMLEHRSHL